MPFSSSYLARLARNYLYFKFMVQKIFVKKIGFVVSIAVFLFLLIPQNAGASGSCIFDPAMEETINTLCNGKVAATMIPATQKSKEAGFCDKGETDCFSHLNACLNFKDTDGVTLLFPKMYNKSFGEGVLCNDIESDGGYKLIYAHCYAGDCKNKGTPLRYLCGWEDMSQDMCNEKTPACMKNWSSCYFDQNSFQCQLAPDQAKTFCENFLNPGECEKKENKQKHGCKWEETVQNGCYCVSNASAAAGKTNDYVKETIQTKAVTNKDASVCVDLPFSRSDTFSKCAWFVDDKKIDEGVRTDLDPGTGNNGCWCQKFSSKNVNEIFDYNLITYSIFSQKACESWIFGSQAEEQNLQYCYWKENGKTVSITEMKSNTAFNGCYCSKDTVASVNDLKKGWEKVTGQEAYQKDTCLNIKAISNGSWQQCAWAENDIVVDHGTAQGKEGCYCNTVKDAELKFIPTLTQSKQKCLDAPASEHRPLCEWWDKNKMVSSTTNVDASGDSQKYAPTPYVPVPFVIPPTDSLNKLGTIDPKIFIGRLITTVMGIMGSIALVMMVYGGILYMTDAGKEEQEKKAKHIVVWTALGLAVIFASYAILKIIFEAVT